MFDVGGGELLLILFAALLLFGPKKIPEIAQMVGKGMQKVRQAQAQLQSQMTELQTEIKTVIEEPVGSVSTSSSPPTRTIENPSDAEKTSEEIEELYRRNNGEMDIVEVPKRVFPDEITEPNQNDSKPESESGNSELSPDIPKV